MSGDVQPRKRKEKRRKREDDDAGTPPPMLVNPLEQSMENVTLHVHKEGGTGGHWCARIIFFALFTVLIGLIGVIIFEYRGTTDVDTPIASSRWAMIFDGWVDDVVPLHEEESHTVDKHEEDHEEDEGLGSDDEEEEGNDDEADENSDENAVSQEEEDEEEENDDEDEENSPEQDQVEDEEEIEDKSDDEGFEDDEDDIGVLDEVEYEESVEDNDDDDEEEEDVDEDDIENISVPDLDISIEGINPSSKQDEEDDELDYELVGITGVNEIEDDSAEPLEEIEGEEPEEIINEIEIEPLVEEITEEESTSVAVKFGVGVALVIAAHFVLVRRWNNVDTDLVAHADGLPDLMRRNTIVPPGNAKQPILTDKYINPVGSQKDIQKEADVITAGQLKKKESQEVFTSESERFSGTENESDYDYDEDELDDEEIEEEEEEEDEIEEEDEEELDDSQLVAKLEAKYGKLPTPSQSEEEDDESEEEDEEEEEEVDEKKEEEIENWKRSNTPKIVHTGGIDKTKNNRPQDVSKSRQGTSAPRGGRQAADIGHSEDHNELTFQEEIENWLAGDLDN